MENKICQNCKNTFVIESEDFLFYKKMDVPSPAFCHDCRLQSKMATFNVRSLYNRTCDMCKGKTISMYHPESPYVIYCLKCYFSDKWDPLDYGVDYDFSVDFFTQFNDLMLRIPHICLEQLDNNGEGCEYANYTYHSSDVYLSYNVVACERIYYSTFANKRNKMCIDSLNFKENELCYEIVDSNGNYGCSFLTKSQQCMDSQFLFNCVNCQDCFMCSNQRSKKYMISNEQYSKEEYKKKLKNFKMSSYSQLEKFKVQYKEIMDGSIVRFATIINSVDCVGDMIENSKNVKNSFYVWNSENLKYVTYSVNTIKDAYDILDGGRSELMYQAVCNGRGCYNTAFCFSIGNTQNCFYGTYCNDLKNAFGCVNVKGKNNCILNKQYDEETFKDLRKKIIEQMKEIPYIDKRDQKYFYGDFFPIEISPFGYNETLAIEEFPITKEEALSLGYKWIDNDKKIHQAEINATDLPDDISEISDDIVTKTIQCPNEGDSLYQCTNAFRILPDELAFYKRMKLPLPHLCPNCRYYFRRSRMLPMKLYNRSCMCDLPNHSHSDKCEVEFETSYAPDRSEKVFCEKCYQQEVI